MRLVILAEVRLYREGLAQVLGRDRRLQVLASASDAEAGVRACAELTPELALCSASACIGPGIVGRIRVVSPDTRVVVIGVPAHEAAILAWAEAGVVGYVTEEQSLLQLKQTIDELGRGGASCSPLVSDVLLRRIATLARESTSARSHPSLTHRETQILHLIQRGLSNKQIAGELSIELATVKNHVHNILGKLGVRRRADAVAVVHGAMALSV
jgi:two-component system, NarL family, nitrate/nitrite response regulator NarL